MMSPALVAHRRVATSARSLTHVRVRSLTCSLAPWAALTMAGDGALASIS
jgi:hypothetical protein